MTDLPGRRARAPAVDLAEEVGDPEGEDQEAERTRRGASA